MLDDFMEERIKDKYKHLCGFIKSENLKKFFFEKIFLEELNALNSFHKLLVNHRMKNILQEKSVKRDHFFGEDTDILNIFKNNLSYKFHRNVLNNIISESFAMNNSPEEIINYVILWDKIFDNLNYFSSFNFDNKISIKEKIDEKYFNQKFKEKYFNFMIFEIDDLYLEEAQKNQKNNLKTNNVNDATDNKNKRSNDKSFISNKSLNCIKFNENFEINKNIKIEEKSGIVDLCFVKKFFEGKFQLRRNLTKFNQRFSYIPLDCNGFCNKINNFVKKSFFSHLFSNEEFMTFKANISHSKNKNLIKEKFKQFTLEDFMEFEILIYKNCLFSHNQNEINYHMLKYKTRYCKQNKCNFLNCEKVHRDVCLEDELVILYQKSSKDFQILEKFFADKINEKYNSRLKFINDLNLNNLEDHFDNENSRNLKNENQYNNSKDNNLSDETILSFSNTRNKNTNIMKMYEQLEKIKTEQCQLKNLCLNKKECFKYHNLLERRRDCKDFIIQNNLPCDKTFIDGKWIDPKKCPNGDSCEFFHTKNELFYDKRNFRKLYECYIEKEKGECPYFEICPYKHNIDINLNEIFLPKEQIEILEKNFSIYYAQKHKYEILKLELENSQEIKNSKCFMCKQYIIDNIVFLKCMHVYCLNCLEELKNNNKNCILKCLNNHQGIKFEQNKDYFIKSLKENFLLIKNFLSDKSDGIVIMKNSTTNSVKYLKECSEIEKKNEEFKKEIDQSMNSDNNVLNSSSKIQEKEKDYHINKNNDNSSYEQKNDRDIINKFKNDVDIEIENNYELIDI